MLDVFCAYFAVACVLWFQSCNLHCYVLSHFFNSVINYVCFNIYKNTDLTAHMCVGSNETVLFCNLSKSSDVHVLADNCDLSCKSFFNSLSCVKCPCFCKKSIDICCCCVHSLSCYICNVVLEFFILSYEVCLSVNFYNNCFLSIFGN